MTLVTVHVQCAASENIHTHPIPWKVSGNFEGVGGGGGGGGLKSQNFKRPVWGLTGISRGVGIQTKNLPWEGYGYFLEQHNKMSPVLVNNHIPASLGFRLSSSLLIIKIIFLLLQEQVTINEKSREMVS